MKSDVELVKNCPVEVSCELMTDSVEPISFHFDRGLPKHYFVVQNPDDVMIFSAHFKRILKHLDPNLFL